MLVLVVNSVLSPANAKPLVRLSKTWLWPLFLLPRLPTNGRHGSFRLGAESIHGIPVHSLMLFMAHATGSWLPVYSSPQIVLAQHHLQGPAFYAVQQGYDDPLLKA